MDAIAREAVHGANPGMGHRSPARGRLGIDRRVAPDLQAPRFHVAAMCRGDFSRQAVRRAALAPCSPAAPIGGRKERRPPLYRSASCFGWARCRRLAPSAARPNGAGFGLVALGFVPQPNLRAFVLPGGTDWWTRRASSTLRIGRRSGLGGPLTSGRRPSPAGCVLRPSSSARRCCSRRRIPCRGGSWRSPRRTSCR